MTKETILKRLLVEDKITLGELLILADNTVLPTVIQNEPRLTDVEYDIQVKDWVN